jgi:hypothetical protein
MIFSQIKTRELKSKTNQLIAIYTCSCVYEVDEQANHPSQHLYYLSDLRLYVYILHDEVVKI